MTTHLEMRTVSEHYSMDDDLGFSVMEIVANTPQQQQLHCHYETQRQNAYSHILHWKM
jgi:uncharacterized protein (UPF0128 family)